ncbi:MAG: deoxyribodipyrimidine photolyase, partial [Asgard group archaeon]|nr:deoxyribodipyrimidine photolyase [Asgard group archaeon]
MIHVERIQKLNNLPLNNNGNFIVYWMQSSNRTEFNHALEYAIEKSNEIRKPIIVFYGLTASFPEANERHYYFLLEGLQEVETNLIERGIKFVVQKISPEKGALKIAKDAALVIVDRGYLNIEKKWRQFLSGKLDCSLIQVESNIVVPVEDASDKEEFAAYTIRPKINKKLNKYLVPLNKRKVNFSSKDYDFTTLNLLDLNNILNEFNIDKTVKKVSGFTGGYSKAKLNLQEF